MSPYDDEEILQEKDKYQLLVESIVDYAIILLDASGYIETWNIGAQKIHGLPASEAIGEHISLFYTPRDIDDNKPEKEMLHAAQDNSIELEDWRVKNDGYRFWADVSLTALCHRNGTLIGFAMIIKDVTDKKRSKNALVAANKLLKHQHLELEALNSVKDEFVSLASHQLRTPATGIKQFLGLLIEGYAGELTEQQRSYLQKAYESNERQIDLVNSLLRTAQIDAGKVILDKSLTDLRTTVEEVVDGLRDVFESRNQQVYITADSDIARVDVDEPRIRMVLENLIDNASKYTDIGGYISIHFSETKLYIKITIRDTGVGIAEKDIDRVFDKFNRIPNKLSESAGGTGLGLYWAKKIIALHRGTITVSSQVDVGTEFIIKLPKGVQRA